MLPVIQANVITGIRERSTSNSNSGSVKGPSPVELTVGSPEKPYQNSFRGAAPPSRLVSPATHATQSDGAYPFPFPAANQAPTTISSAPTLAPRVTLPVREAPVSSLSPYQPPSSSPILTSSHLPVSSGFLTAPTPLMAPSNITPVGGAATAPSAIPEVQLRVLFETADSNRDGYLEWNTGDVEAFGKAVLDRYGRDSDGSQVLLYNVYDEMDRNIDGKMDVHEGMQFARSILTKSSPFKPAVPPGTTSSLFDTKASSAPSVWDTYPNFVEREPYCGPVFSTGQLQPQVQPPVKMQDGPQNGTHSSESLEFKRLERENARLVEDNRMMQNRLYDLEKELLGQDLSLELARTQQENEKLSRLAQEYKNKLDAKTKEQVKSFDPVANDERANQLEEENHILRARLESAVQQVSSDQHRDSEIARELQNVLHENDRLADINRQLEQQLRSRGGAMDQGSFAAAQGSFAGLEVEALQEREKRMSKEIDQLMLENSQLKDKLEAYPGGPAPDTKKKKFVCC